MSLNLRRLLGLLAVLALVAVLPAAATGDDDGRYEIPFTSGTVEPARDFAPADPVDHDLVLVQWEQFGDAEVIRAIDATGAALVQPLAPVNYLVWADAAQTQAIRDLDGVRFAGVLPAGARVAASVSNDTTTLRVTFVGEPEALPAGVDLRPRAFTQLPGGVATLAGDAADALRVAAHPRVYSVADASREIALRDEQSSQIVAQGTVDGAHTEPGYLDFLDEIGADGSGVTVHIQDGGVDFNHPDLQGQVVECFDSGIPLTCEVNNNDDAIGHGTHVLGVILGTGTLPLADTDGFTYGLGMAPAAKAVVHNDINLVPLLADSVADTWFPDGFAAPYQQAVLAGATVSNNSWGPSGTPQGYDEDTREFDQIARDANPDSDVDEPLALSWSIMNGQGGESTQGAPDEAKNILAVGGSGARGSRTADDLCTCTAHGPNLDGRRLVDFVAPGQSVVSTRATQGALCGTAAGGSIIHMPPSPFHGPCTGTSFASPHVTGTIAVFTDWYRQHVDADATPSPPLLKAALANTADDLSAFNGRDADGRPLEPIPNDRQGWGRVNLGNLIEAWETGVVFVDQDVAFTDSGQTYEITVEAIDPDAPLKATLAWADAPGHGQGGELPAWVNDLDLVVSDGETAWLGNDFADGWSTTGGEPDEKNNLEAVHLEQAGDGTYTVTIKAANLMDAASPNVDELLWQDFALVVSNAQLVDGDSGSTHPSSVATRRAPVDLPSAVGR